MNAKIYAAVVKGRQVLATGSDPADLAELRQIAKKRGGQVVVKSDVQANPPKLTPRAEIGPVQLWTSPDGSLWRSGKASPRKPNGQPEKAYLVTGPRADNHEAVLRDMALQYGGGQPAPRAPEPAAHWTPVWPKVDAQPILSEICTALEQRGFTVLSQAAEPMPIATATAPNGQVLSLQYHTDPRLPPIDRFQLWRVKDTSIAGEAATAGEVLDRHAVWWEPPAVFIQAAQAAPTTEPSLAAPRHARETVPPVAPTPTAPTGPEREVACVFHQLRNGDYFHTGKKIPTRPDEVPTWQIWRKTSKSTADLEESRVGDRSRHGNDGHMTTFGPQNSVWTASLERLRQPPVRPMRKTVEFESGTPLANRKALLDANRTYIRDVRKAEPLDNWRTKTPQVAVLRYDGCTDARLYSDRFRLYFLGEPQEPYTDLFGIYALAYNEDTAPHIVWLDNENAQVVKAEIIDGERRETIVGDAADSAIRMVRNVQMDRLQIFFPGRPNQDQLRSLKGSGWHWSPTNNCWMRKLTAAAVRSAENIVQGYGKHPSSCDCEACQRAQAARMEDFRWR